MNKLFLAAALVAVVLPPAHAREARYDRYSASDRYSTSDRYAASDRYSSDRYSSGRYSSDRSSYRGRYSSGKRAAANTRTCDGRYATIRTSEIKPGKWAEFESAVNAHRAWYVQHGKLAEVTLTSIARRGSNGAGGGEAVTITLFHDAAAGRPEHDAAWQHFVAAYKDSSTIKAEQRVCLAAGSDTADAARLSPAAI